MTGRLMPLNGGTVFDIFKKLPYVVRIGVNQDGVGRPWLASGVRLWCETNVPQGDFYRISHRGVHPEAKPADQIFEVLFSTKALACACAEYYWGDLIDMPFGKSFRGRLRELRTKSILDKKETKEFNEILEILDLKSW